eukprot:6490734-Amphidinium_carterae.1
MEKVSKIPLVKQNPTISGNHHTPKPRRIGDNALLCIGFRHPETAPNQRSTPILPHTGGFDQLLQTNLKHAQHELRIARV